MLDINKLRELGDKALKAKMEIETVLGVEDSSDLCSKQNLTIAGGTDHIRGLNTGTVDDAYNPGF